MRFRSAPALTLGLLRAALNYPRPDRGVLKRALQCRKALSRRLRLGPWLVALWLVTGLSSSDKQISRGDVFVSTHTGRVLQFSPGGALRRTIETGRTGELDGSSFDKAGNFYVSAGFSGGDVLKFDSALRLQGVFGSGYRNNPESIMVDAAGNIYVGVAQSLGRMATIKKLDAGGGPLETYIVEREDRGSDWIDLASDQKTIFYTSEGSEVKRYDTQTKTQLRDFSNAGGAKKYALRILPDGGVLVANTRNVLRLDKSGRIAKTYLDNSNLLFALNLDPDGTSFWTAEARKGDLFRVDIASGRVITRIHTGVNMGGLSVYGELTASVTSPPSPPPQPPPQSTPLPLPPPPPPTPPPAATGLISFGPPIPCAFGTLTSRSEGRSALDLSSSNVTGNVDVTIQSSFHVPGATLEVHTASGWTTVSNSPIHLRGAAPLSWPVRLRVDDCPGTIRDSDQPEIEVTATNIAGKVEHLRVPVQAEIKPDSWLQCWRPALLALAGILLAMFVFYGFWSPSRFGPRVGVRLSPEEDIENEGFFYLIKGQPGSRSGFYRSAVVYVGADFRVSGKASNAVAKLRADGNQVRMRPMASIARRGADGEWEALPHEETTMRTGVLYRNDARSLFFELRSR
jgi:hypothetical protein